MSTSAGEVRLIGGTWKRSRLPVLDRPDLRPTPNRVRETLFNWLGQDLTGWRCLDAFAGTGALGLEAASRGARQVVLVESDLAVAQSLQTVCQRLQAQQVVVERGDGIASLRRSAGGDWDVVFLDPPFDAPLFEAALAAAAAAVSAAGFVYLEAPQAWQPEALQPLGLVRTRYVRAASVHAHLLQRAP